ncbi:MAG: hypothetical protein CMD68_03075 [Gammaproteobacteria bacterium]|nr:hypothetical protein [Gammaproteobacteria bacterium]
MNYKKIFILFFILFLSPIEAHNRSESYSKFQFITADEGVEVKITGTIKQSIFRLLKPEVQFQSYEDFIKYLSSSIDLGVNCQLKNSVKFNENNASGVLKLFWDFKCIEIPSGVSISLFQDLGITHTHIARGSIDGVSIPEFMFANKSDYWLINSLSQQKNNQSSYLSYVYSGIEHILSGWDHLVFLLGLLLLYSGRLLLIAITGFTIGHSLTLGFGAMNILRVHSVIVEILIGFSILILAMEKFFKHNYELQNFKKNLLFALLAFFPLGILGILEPLLLFGLALFLTIYLSLTLQYSSMWIPLLITIFFGLIHGLGFASSISDVGIPQDKLLPIILSFNLGVEVGQLAVAFGILGLLAMAKNSLSSFHFNSIHNFAGTVVFSMGTFWFVSRAIGI